jgi:1-deoxy-D-xylulose-5-phosphate synthase
LFSHYDFGFIKPLDEALLHEIFRQHEEIVTIEDGCITGGFGSTIAAFATRNGYTLKIRSLGIPDNFIEHGTVNQLQHYCGIDVKSLKDIFSAY